MDAGYGLLLALPINALFFIFSLGMRHDASGNACTKDGYVMSSSRGTQGETTWSSCSAAAVKELS